MTGDNDAASDIVQESFVRLYKSLGDNGDIRNAAAWLYRVATNLCHSRYRRVRQSDRLRHEPATQNHVASSPEDALIRKERLERVRAAICELTERDRLLVMLYQERLSYAEIARITGIKVTSVGKLLARAIDRLAATVTREETV